MSRHFVSDASGQTLPFSSSGEGIRSIFNIGSSSPTDIIHSILSRETSLMAFIDHLKSILEKKRAEHNTGASG